MIKKSKNNLVKDRYKLTVFRSNKFIYATILDHNGRILVSASDIKLDQKINKVKRAEEVGKNIAKEALKIKISKIVFDRKKYKYHGRVKSLAEGARASGLQF